MKNDCDIDDDSQPMMILTIDIGNGHYDKLQLFDLNNIDQETYDFCVKNKLDFSTMQEIISQINSVIKDKQFQENQEVDNFFQEIKEEDAEERITENEDLNNNNNEKGESNSNKKENIEERNDNENKSDYNNNENKNYVKEEMNAFGHEKYNNFINVNKDGKNTSNNKIQKINNINENNNNQKKKKFAFKKKNIKNNLKEVFAMAKEHNKEKEINNIIKQDNEIKNANKEFSTKNNNNDYNENDINPLNNNVENKSNKKNRNINSEFKNSNIVQKIDHFRNNNSKESNENKNMNKFMSKTISNFNNKYNPGKELYKRGIKYIESEKEKLQALKRNLEIEDLENNTFSPKINKISQIQSNKRKEKRLECSNPEVIKNYMQYKKFKLEYLKQKTNKDFNKIHTFKPSINNRPLSNAKTPQNNKKNIDNNNEKNKITRFEKLYNYRLDYKQNNNKLKEKIYNEYSFKPKINENSSFYKLNIPFNQRLQTYSNKSKENKIKIQQIYEKELGYRESFKPQLNINRNKILLKDRDNHYQDESQKNNNINEKNYIDPYTKLYLYGKKYEQEKNDLAEKYYQSQNRNPKFCEINNEIINKKKEKSFKRIFKLLDADDDSKITPSNICTSRLPKNILKILEPIFNELKEENESLNEVEFIFVCEHLYLSLPWDEQRELATFEDIEKKNIKKEKMIKEKNNYVFKPQINKKRNFSHKKPTILYEKKNFYQRNNNIERRNSEFITTVNNKNKEIKKINKNIINSEITTFNINIQNNEILNNTIHKDNNYKNNINSNGNTNNYYILKNTEIIIIGNKNNNQILNKKSKKINYDTFINVKKK